MMSNRWAFEAIGRILDLDGRLGGGSLGAWERAFQGDASTQVVALAAMIVACTAGTVITLRRRLTPR
jgi:hypothetical protein